MRVDPSAPFRLIYSLHAESEIGPVIEPFVVQLHNNNLSLTYQRLNLVTMRAFASALDASDREIIRLSTEYSLETITKKFSKKEVKPQEFLSRYLDEKLLKDVIRPYVDEKVNRCLQIMVGKPLYLRGKSGNPAHKPIEMEPEEVSVYFHLTREEEGTRYYPTFRCKGQSLSFVNAPVMLVTNRPCLLLSDNRLYRFEPEMEGQKLKPFFSKWNIHIPKHSEPVYFRRFITQLVEKHTVIAKGFDIYHIEEKPIPCLKMEMGWNNQPQLMLYFDYHKEKIAAAETRRVAVRLEKQGDHYTYYRIGRRDELENRYKEKLAELGLKADTGSVYMPELPESASPVYALVNWINTNRRQIEDAGIRILEDGLSTNYYLGEISLDFDVKEENDWFDVYAIVRFGTFQIPFVKLRKYILNEITEFPLPDGKLAVIPSEWFSRYKELLSLSNEGEEGRMVLKRHHFTLLDDLFRQSGGHAELNKDTYLELAAQNGISAAAEVPESFKEVLRPYQAEGFQWMEGLRQKNFGGCLADDMGLGKTVQTLCLLSKLYEEDEEEFVLPANGQLSLFGETEVTDAANQQVLVSKKTNQVRIRRIVPSLIAMPTSLVHNWHYEVKKWATGLKVINYTGLDRADKIRLFGQAHLILTTYGTLRNDVEILKNHEFRYLILDESQMIKNPLSKVSRAVKQLRARHRLSLSGTPIENSLTDLWSQFSFLNPGMLGNFQYFRNEFVIPVEKKKDDKKMQKLRMLIQPFILRRTKEEVAKELPELMEKVYFSEMSQEQSDLYEQTRNYYRKKILENIEEWGEQRSQFFVLRGLMQLRLIASHPRLQDPGFEGSSGKFEDITTALESILAENHRVLVFSQFVRHLDLIAAWLRKGQIPFAMLTGQTRMREAEIRSFKENEKKQVFLISLKAGGVGLNLTEADYVFLCDPWWNPAAEKQAINRAHRIGQDKPVFAYKFISKNSVEEKILLLQERKLKLSDALISSEGQKVSFTKEDVEMLFS